MVEFNPDGSIKLSGTLAKNIEENSNRMRSQRCIKVRKEIVSFTAPKRCVLHVTLSDVLTDIRFMGTIFNQYKESASVPSKITQIDEHHFDIEIGTNFKRCSDCSSLIARYREFLDGNLIEEKGGCTFEANFRNFSYEDYFE